MTNKQDHFNQTTSDGSLLVDHEELSIAGTSINSDERIHYNNRDDHEKYTSCDRSEDTETITEYSPDIGWAAAAKSLEKRENATTAYSRLCVPCNNDKTNGASVEDIDRSKCVATQPSENRHLPKSILKLFPDRSEREVIEVLKPVQDEQEKIWEKINKKYENYNITKQIARLKRDEFNRDFETYLSQKFPSEQEKMKNAMQILQGPSFGILFVNSKKEIFAVQNYHGTWSAPKGHSIINERGELEIEPETAGRETCEEVSIESKSKREKTINKENIGQLLDLNKRPFLQCPLSTTPDTNDGLRLIGLFVVYVDEQEWKFTLNDKKENKECGWLKMEDILNNMPEPRRDIYYTLRPFVKYLDDHPEFLQNK